MTIQDTIRIQIGQKSAPSEHDLLCFVGMLESGEASYPHFLAVGGWALLVMVAYRRGYSDAERDLA